LEACAVLAGFTLLAVLMTWPLARHFGSQIPGAGSGGDASGYVWDLWFNATHGLRLFGVSVQDVVSAPFGRELPGSANATLLTTVGPAWVIAKVFSPIAAYNSMMIAGLALSGSSMYLCVRWLRLGVGPAIWAGVSFVLFPQEILRLLGHLPLVQMECFPLMVMAGLFWLAGPSWRRGALMAAAAAFGWLSNPYYGVMCSIMLVVFAAWGLAVMLRRDGLKPAAARIGELAAAAFVILILPLLVLFASARGAVDSVFRRDPVELLLYGAQPSDYIRPLGSNPVWSTLFGSPFPNPSGERLNYVGWVTIVLALVGVAVALWPRAGVGGTRRTAARVALALVPVLFLFSLASPMTFFGVTIEHMPSRIVFDALPFLRVFARFVVPVMAVLLVAGAVGLWYLLRGRSELWRMSVLAGVLLLTAADLPTPLPVSSAAPVTIDGRTAQDVPVWRWLAGQDHREIVFDLPGRPNELVERFYMYGQTVHGHPIAGGGLFAGQLGYDFVNQTGDAAWPNTPPWLASAGIGLVTINPWAYAMTGREAPDPARPPKGFTVERTFPDGSAVWRVTADPADAVPVFRDGWWSSERLRGDGIWRWMSDEGRITVVAPRAGDYRMTFRAHGLDDAPYPLAITLPDGSVRRVTVGPERTVTLPVRLAGTRGDVVIRNEGAPARYPVAGDARLVTVQVDEPVLTRAGD
jgi:hypothetical protein